MAATIKKFIDEDNDTVNINLDIIKFVSFIIFLKLTKKVDEI